MGGGLGAFLLKVFRSRKNNSLPARAIAKQRRTIYDDRNNQQNGTAPGSLSVGVGEGAQGSSG
jgi:hypothetical protein